MALDYSRGGRGGRRSGGRGGRGGRGGGDGGRGGRGHRGGSGRGHGRGTADLNEPQDLPQAANVLSPSLREMMERGLRLVGFERLTQSDGLKEKRFRSFYGIGPKAFIELYKLMDKPNNRCNLQHLFMALNWLKLYDPEGVLAARWKLSEETLRVHIGNIVDRIAALVPQLITFGPFGEETFIASVDGTHCPIQEPRTDPGSKWYSHKFNGPGLSYELAIAIRSNQLVWLNGPYPASYADITIFRRHPSETQSLMTKIPHNKRIIGDSGYSGEPEKVSITRPDDDAETKKFKARVKSRQENFNGRLKNFRILLLPFRHSQDRMKRHEMAFKACCVCIQLEIQNGNGLYEV